MVQEGNADLVYHKISDLATLELTFPIFWDGRHSQYPNKCTQALKRCVFHNISSIKCMFTVRRGEKQKPLGFGNSCTLATTFKDYHYE